MDYFERASEHWFSWALALSWQLAVLVCLVAILARAARWLSPRIRYLLWMLVLIKVFLPPSLSAPWGFGRWGVPPLVQRTSLTDLPGRWTVSERPAPQGDATIQRPSEAIVAAGESIWSQPLIIGALVWCAGCLTFWGWVAGRYIHLNRLLRVATVVDEGPLRVALERAAIAQQLHDPPELLLTNIATGPFLVGVLRPRIVLPGEAMQLSAEDLQAVLSHELVHWRRRDTWVGWLQVVAQGLLWFHPLVWWANRQLRHERECACDEGVLSQGQIAPERYGELLVRVLTAARARSLVGGSLVGVFERGAHLQERLEDIMSFEPKRRVGWLSRLGLVMFALLFLPMAPGLMQSQAADRGPAAVKPAATNEATPYPRVVKSAPEAGATGVSAALQEITVTFDRDMQGGMSWTGGPPLFPTVDESKEARWVDNRSCVLPVKLEKGAYYRVGINSTSYQNFKSADGVPAPPTAIYFATEGASAAVNARVRAPRIVSLSPQNDASDVDPSTKALRVKFNVPMGDGMSWTGGGENFPEIPADKQPKWSKDGLTCTLPVSLRPDHTYRLGLNSSSHINFESKWGVPLPPVEYTFRTARSGK